MTVNKFAYAVKTLAEAYRDNNLPVIEEQRLLLYEALEEFTNFYIQNNIYLDSTSIRMLLYEYGNLLEPSRPEVRTAAIFIFYQFTLTGCSAHMRRVAYLVHFSKYASHHNA